MSTWYSAESGVEQKRLLDAWPDAPIQNTELCGTILTTAREQVIAYGPTLPEPPETGTIELGPVTVNARNIFPDPSIGAPGTPVEVRRNLWKTPAMSNMAMVTAQGATLTVVADGLRVTSAGTSPYRATTTAAQRVAVSPSTTYWVTARRTIAAAVGTATGMNGRMGIVGYDSAGSHRSNAYSITLGTAPAVGVEIIEQQITTPDWVVSLEVNFISGSNNGDAVVWGRVAITTGTGYFDGDSPSPDPDMTTSWAGQANASPSLLSAEAVAGIVTRDCLAIRSGQWAADGAQSMRIIPTGPVPAVILATVAGVYTMLATYCNSLGVVGTINEGVTGAATLYPPAGENTWYDRLGLFAGDYNGEWFDGDTPDRLTYSHSWEGAANASPSVETYRPNVFVPDPVEVPDRFVYAQLQQARNLWNAGRTTGEGDVGPDGYVFRPYPLDKTIKQIIRPVQGVPHVL